MLKQIFSQCKIILEGTLIVKNLKMINKMSTLPPHWKMFCRRPWNDRAFSLSFSRYFRAFPHCELFVSFRSLNFGYKINRINRFLFYFIKITCNDKGYTQITMVLLTIPNDN